MIKLKKSRKNINIVRARMHNLKNISLEIPKEKLIIISGVSGSGKSSLAFNTLFAEGQRRYIESLSSYARQFLGKLKKPKVESISGICPAIAIKQKTKTSNPRSTIATSTEIYDYLKLLFARIGKTISPISKKEVKCHQINDIVDFVEIQNNKEIIMILCKYYNQEDNMLQTLQKQGFSKILHNNNICKVHELIEKGISPKKENIYIIIDRIIINNENIRERISDSIETALFEGQGKCSIKVKNKIIEFSNKFECDNMRFEHPSVNLFSFNSPYGACKRCNGFGSILGIDREKVIVNENLSLNEGVVSCWNGKKLSKWKDRFITRSAKFNFPIHKAYKDLSQIQKELLWNGKEKCKGINQFFEKLDKDKYKIQNRVLIARYRGKTKCVECKGTRLRKDALYVEIAGHSIADINAMSIEECMLFFKKIKFTASEKKISERLIIEIKNRLQYLNDVGLGYLTLNRKSNTLSGGESQRINLATSLGSSLVGAMYILDEPSIGLHPKDTERLIHVLKKLRDIGNTVIVVEHDEEIMENADQIIDIGPEAGNLGGEIMFQGTLKNIYKQEKSLTTQYLSGKLEIPIPKNRKILKDKISISGINQHNLKNIDVSLPLNGLTLITGMSGSGKSTLIKDVLIPALNNHLGKSYITKKNYRNIKVQQTNLNDIEFIDQNPIGKSSRSNPATYIKVYDDIRKLFANQPLAKIRNYKPGYFSFNIPGGRCEECEGEGEKKIEMQFMADVHLECQNCKGKRFKEEILEIKFSNKDISEILDLSVKEAIIFFQENKKYQIAKKLQPLYDVGLSYIKLGQSSSTLSGGEAQRIKLASFLGKANTTNNTLFIFDEPTTGLHFHDINKLLESFYALIKAGNSIICIEHNIDVIKCADWIIDLGPEGGKKGGKIIFEGTPEEIIKCKTSITGNFLKKKLTT